MSLRRNTALNLASLIVPSLVSILVVPLYLRTLGESRYGVLTMVWLLVGYFGLFDLGLSRATANLFARLRESPQCERETLFWTAFSLNMIFGVIAGVVLWLCSGLLLTHYFSLPEDLRREALAAVPWIAASMPLSIMAGVMTGVLEGEERFALANTIGVGSTLMAQLAPALLALYGFNSLSLIVPASVLTRAITLILPLGVTMKRMVPLTGRYRISQTRARGLLSYGGWISVNTLLDPIFSSLDRMILGGGPGADAVAEYTVPYTLVHRMQILPTALTRALFPRFSFLPGSEGSALAQTTVRGLSVAAVPLFVALILLLHPFMQLWVGAAFAARARGVGEVLALGVWINLSAWIAFSLLQGQGRVRTVALLHVAEAPLMILVLWYAVGRFGITGAAWALTGRYALDSLIFLSLAQLLMGIWRTLATGAGLLVLAFMLTNATSSRVGVPAGALLLTVAASWAWRSEPAIAALFRRSVQQWFP